MLKIGSKAPTFTCMNNHGAEFILTDFIGKKVILYFYPQDNTPTCTEQACNIRDNYKSIIKLGYTIFGISPDSPKKHQNFIKKQNLPFELLCDEAHAIAMLYDVWGEKMLFGRKYMGVIRTTFIINEKGKIENIIFPVVAKNHSQQIFDLIK